MAKINDATNIKLSGLVTGLGLAGADGGKELRSQGVNLYVKDRKALFSSVSRRQAHQQDAVALVVSSLRREFNLNSGVAERVMANVFGRDLTQINVGQVRQLNDVAENARQYIDKGIAPEIALQLSKRELDMQPQALENRIDDFDGKSYSRIDAKIGILVADAAIRGDISESDAKNSLAGNQKNVFLDCLKETADGLPRYEASDGTQKAVWTRIGKCLTHSVFPRMGDLAGRPLGQRASMHQALSDNVIEAATRDDGDAVREAYESVVTLNSVYKLSELVPNSEKQKMRAFLLEAEQSATLDAAKADWKGIGKEKRRDAIQEIIQLHAKHFGYSVPNDYVVVGDMGDKDISGGYKFDKDSRTHCLQLNTASADFRRFNTLFNTVVHESTHRYQQHLVDELAQGRIRPGDDRYQQARIMTANDTAGVFQSVLDMVGFNMIRPYDAYRNAPNEIHAFDQGDFAQITFVPRSRFRRTGDNQ